MDPVQSSLDVWKARRGDMADDVAVGRDSESDAVDDTFIANTGTGHHVDVGHHSRPDVSQLGFAEVGNDPPCACVDEREDVLTRGCVGSLRNGEVGNAGIEGARMRQLSKLYFAVSMAACLPRICPSSGSSVVTFCVACRTC